MIADLDETLRKLLQAELPIKNGEVDVAFDQPKREWSTRLSHPTIDFFLYDLRENPVLRQNQWEQAPGAGPQSGQYHLKRSPLRVDCFYMLTAWAHDPGDEHRLLSRCMLALFRFPVLPTQHLAGGLKNQPFEIPARLANHDQLPNAADIWSALDNEIRPSVSYVITIALDPWQEISGPLVRTRTLRTALTAVPARQMSQVEGTVSDLLDFGGVVLSRSRHGEPLPGISVAVKGTGLFATTGADGRYTLGSLPPGAYTIVAWAEAGKPVERSIQLPGKTESYDFEL